MVNHSKSESQLLDDLRERVRQFGRQAVVARELGFTPQYLCDVLGGNRPVSDKLASALGYDRVVRYEPRRKNRNGDAR